MALVISELMKYTYMYLELICSASMCGASLSLLCCIRICRVFWLIFSFEIHIFSCHVKKKPWQYNSVSQFVDQTAHMNNTCLCMY